MNKYTKEEISQALQVVTSTIKNCKNFQPKSEKGNEKFQEGSPTYKRFKK